ncbi:MAG: flagellar type III secretion system pore protein FliP [Succinivibrionaceae bacterium]|nr:flagellar type III secretion system pore protein FliP [Succinivibrionaceae bacterium]
MKRISSYLWAALLLLAPALCQAADFSIPAVTLSTNADGEQEYSLSMQVLLFLTALTVLPSLIMMVTSFTRFIIVMSILRQAIGLQASPSNQILVGMSLFMTMFVMSPVFNQIYDTAIVPYTEDQISGRQAFELAQKPLKTFMLSQTRIKDLNSFMEYSGEKADKPEELSMKVIIPAFMVSELKTAFQIGFMIFLPFLVIDLVVASILMAMGMMMLSPVLIALPFKLMLFVLVDGWSMIIGTMIASFGIGAG